ncbi:Egl nine 1-like protein [Favolaschia claudopus]|uniref:Egl nine 1-like protein n=1 Tax=Favolaschia claudopus TaxID=2862362 RepID=A0AAW0ABJ6_9AGAR
MAFFPPPTDMLSSLLGTMRDNYDLTPQTIAETFGLIDGKWKDFVRDKCTFQQRMVAGLNHGKFVQATFGRNPALEPITNELASLHLPALIEAYTSSYEIRTPLDSNWMDSWERFYGGVLGDCLQTMYFSRWMRKHSPEAVGLMNTLAEQLARAPMEWPHVYEAQRQLERLEIFLWAALRTRQCAPKQAVHIPLETRQKVIPYLKNLKKLVNNELRNPKWRQDLAAQNLELALKNIENALMHYLDGEQRFGGKRDVTMRGQVQQRWDVCAAKSSNCTVSDKKRLRECAKCHTVRYCCPEHQRQHWKEHKPTCFAPAY